MGSAASVNRSTHGNSFLKISEEAQVNCIILRQGASGLRDKQLIEMCNEIEATAKRQASWTLTRMKAAATQTLIVAT